LLSTVAGARATKGRRGEAVRYSPQTKVAYGEFDVRTAAGVAARLLDHIRRRIDAEDASGRNPPADISRNRAGPAADVEHVGAECEVRGEVSGRVVDGTPLVRPQYTLVGAVGVGHGLAERLTWTDGKYYRPAGVNGRLVDPRMDRPYQVETS
jgi:hypothetical protein